MTEQNTTTVIKIHTPQILPLRCVFLKRTHVFMSENISKY